jgi:3-isopropylmalate dehydrogenase
MSPSPRTILFLPGDGIGPEVMEQVRRVIGWFSQQGLAFEVEEDLVGGAAYDRTASRSPTRPWPRRSRSAR